MTVPVAFSACPSTSLIKPVPRRGWMALATAVLQRRKRESWHRWGEQDTAAAHLSEGKSFFCRDERLDCLLLIWRGKRLQPRLRWNPNICNSCAGKICCFQKQGYDRTTVSCGVQLYLSLPCIRLLCRNWCWFRGASSGWEKEFLIWGNVATRCDLMGTGFDVPTPLFKGFVSEWRQHVSNQSIVQYRWSVKCQISEPISSQAITGHPLFRPNPSQHPLGTTRLKAILLQPLFTAIYCSESVPVSLLFLQTGR